MTHSQPTFELERFEFIPTTARHALLRVRGWWDAGDEEHGAPHLLAVGGARAHRFVPLDPNEAAIGPRAGLAEGWRSAYAVPIELVEAGEVAFRLDGPGGRIELPVPVQADPSDPRSYLQERRGRPDRRRRERREDEAETVAEEEARGGTDRRRAVDRRRRRSEAELRSFRTALSALESQVTDVEAARRELLAAQQAARDEVARSEAARAEAESAVLVQAGTLAEAQAAAAEAAAALE